MALNNKVIWFNIALSFLFLAISGQAHRPSPPHPAVKAAGRDQPAPETPTPSSPSPAFHYVPHDEQSLTDRYLMARMEMASNKVEQFLNEVILKRLNNPFTEESTKDCLRTCQEAYEDSIKAMQKGYVDVSVNNYYKADVDVNAFSTDVGTCEECRVQMIGKDLEVKKFQEWAKGIASDCHAMLQKYTFSI